MEPNEVLNPVLNSVLNNNNNNEDLKHNGLKVGDVLEEDFDQQILRIYQSNPDDDSTIIIMTKLTRPITYEDLIIMEDLERGSQGEELLEFFKETAHNFNEFGPILVYALVNGGDYTRYYTFTTEDMADQFNRNADGLLFNM